MNLLKILGNALIIIPVTLGVMLIITPLPGLLMLPLKSVSEGATIAGMALIGFGPFVGLYLKTFPDRPSNDHDLARVSLCIWSVIMLLIGMLHAIKWMVR